MKVFWTDGSAMPNPGAGGYAVIDAATEKPVALGQCPETTNIRMEGQAIIAAMKLANGSDCEIHTDSHFWIDVLEQWARNWESRGWRKSSKGSQPIRNLDVVKEAYQLYNAGRVQLVWVRGHVGTKLNELADAWANKARVGKTFGDLQIKIELSEKPAKKPTLF